MGAIQGSAHDSYDFEDLIGASGSLRGVVEQAKAACSYPPCGLPLMLVGARGSGREGIERAITRYCVSEGIIADETKRCSSTPPSTATRPCACSRETVPSPAPSPRPRRA